MPSSPKLVAIAVILEDNRVVIGQRPAHVHLAGYWEFPGGHVEEGETLEEAVVREVHEEAGMAVHPLHLLATSTVVANHQELRLSFVTCVPQPGQQPTPPFRWVDCRSLSKFTFPPANGAVIAMLARLSGTDRGNAEGAE